MHSWRLKLMISCISLGYLCLGICAHTTFIQGAGELGCFNFGWCMQRHLVAFKCRCNFRCSGSEWLGCLHNAAISPECHAAAFAPFWWQLLSYQSGKTAACLLVKYTSAWHKWALFIVTFPSYTIKILENTTLHNCFVISISLYQHKYLDHLIN